jgi:histidine phosphotransferase ChpT
MMGHTNINLSALIGSRICHDLISPIGAINNGLELLSMGAMQSDSPELALIGESVENASARIRFFRIAYGAAGDQMVGPGEINSVLRDMCKGSRLDIRWNTDAPQSRSAVRMAFLAIQCLECSMPYGGIITVGVDGGRWVITGIADKMVLSSELWGILQGSVQDEDLAPAHVQFPLLAELAREVDRDVNANTSLEGRVSITF